MKSIIKLPQEVINQIAAGEIIERPASVVKELLDNSIDAQATKISIKISNGGIDGIEIADNGEGISKDNLLNAFEPHATSKISTIEDLNQLMTMGFRGEALSTIKSVAQVTAISKTKEEETASKIIFDQEHPRGEISIAARDNGTTIKVQNLFYNIPARKKYLKSEATEYRKIVETVVPYFLIHPEIHFVFENNGKVVYNLPAVENAIPQTLSKSRIKQTIKSEFINDLIDFYMETESTKIGGLVSQPKYHAPKINHLYVFVNNRPVRDNSIIKAVYQGFSRFIPNGEKIPFIIDIKINPEYVDANIHPRKEEVRFSNPYRIFSSIENAVSNALQKELHVRNQVTQYSSSDDDSQIGLLRLRSNDNKQSRYTSESTLDINFKKQAGNSVRDSLNFTRNILDQSVFEEFPTREDDANANTIKISTTNIDPKSLTQIFNKYILMQLDNEIWVIDQHAAAERASFEKLEKSLEQDTKISQKLLLSVDIFCDRQSLEFLKENISFFNKLGFEYTIEEDKCILTSFPSIFHGQNYEQVFKSLFELNDNELDLKNNYEYSKQSILATIACHTSVRSGQQLRPEEMKHLIEELLMCKNPYSCPHGRPAIWKLSLTEIDKHFERTY